MRKRHYKIPENSWQISISILIVTLLCVFYVYDRIPKAHNKNKKVFNIGIALDSDSIIHDRKIIIKLDSIIIFKDSLSKINIAKPYSLEMFVGKKKLELSEEIRGEMKLIRIDTIRFFNEPINIVRIFFRDKKQENIDIIFEQLPPL